MEIGTKGGGVGGHSVECVCSFERLRYIGTITGLHFEYREREGGGGVSKGEHYPSLIQSLASQKCLISTSKCQW